MSYDKFVFNFEINFLVILTKIKKIFIKMEKEDNYSTYTLKNLNLIYVFINHIFAI